jgi:type IV pilus assembly protein PilV
MRLHLQPRSRGIALMEALIAIVVLSVGALGYAALQVKGLSSSSNSMWRTKAGNLAGDMADRVRANRAGAVDGGYNALTSVASVTDCGATSNCSPARMAQLDHAQWSAVLGSELPRGGGVVCLDATPDDGDLGAPACDGSGGMLAIKVFWAERGVPSRHVLWVRP